MGVSLKKYSFWSIFYLVGIHHFWRKSNFDEKSVVMDHVVYGFTGS